MCASFLANLYRRRRRPRSLPRRREGGGGGGGAAVARAAVAAAPKLRKVSFGAEMSPAKVVVGWHGSGADCSEAEAEKSMYSEEESEWVGGGG